ncbi:carboxypeptidase-like regulatory domain-containing protein [Staphylospora marina]|uniref:carboxypeptidase-like regulatory domain-containing protein n=1 Tax=Staphylospora marina TaxID=2490858 RepID=UPI0013DDC713|nr:carboxypeptidase-like regulatory domain-containing protein [Staphylospora marina]
MSLPVLLRIPALLAAGLALFLSGCGSSAGEQPTTPETPDPPASNERVAFIGTVLDEEQRPVSGALAVPESRDTSPYPVPEIAVYTNEQGVFTWHLPPGSWDFVISKPGYETARHAVSATAGQKEVRFTVNIRKKQ